jgi:hypothetical protein
MAHPNWRGTGPMWSPEEDAILRRMWAAGALFGAIVKAVGRTRNGVASRARTLGLPRRREGSRGQGKDGSAAKVRQLAAARAKANPKNNNPSGMTAARLLAGKGRGPHKLPPSLPHVPRVSIADLGYCQCRYIGERPAVLMLDTPVYCGLATDGGPWCPQHLAAVFRPRGTG